MRANLALPVILPWPRAISTGNWNWPHNSLVVQSQSICTSCRMPNWSGPMPDPVTSVRFPRSAGGGGLFHGSAPAKQRILKADDFDGDDRDRLVAQHPLIGLYLAGDVG